MKKALLALTLVGLLGGNAAAQTTKYWDIDGATAGAGGATPGGVWDTVTSNWTTDATGASAATTWTAGDRAIFSAGSDATGSYTVSGTATASGLTIEDGTVVFSGTVTMGANPVAVNSGAVLETNSSLRVSTSAGSVYTLNGGTLRTTNAAGAGSFIDVDSTITLGASGGTVDYQVTNVLNIIQTTTVISGPGSLTKTGGGVLALASPSTFAGGTIINGGELRMRGGTNRLPTTGTVTVNSGGIFNLNGSGQNQTIGQLLGSGRVGVNNGRLTISGAANSLFTGTIEDVANAGASGATSTGGGITKAGTGSLTLTGASTYTGQTVINGGTVYANNTSGSATGTGSVAVNATATLGGTGSVAGAVSVASGGTLAPGASVESLGTGALTIGAGGTLAYELDSSAALAAAADLVDANGTLTLTAGALLTVTDLAATSTTIAPGTKFTVVRYSGSWDGGIFVGLADGAAFTVGANAFEINYDDTVAGVNFGGGAGGGTYLTLTAVPEASAMLFGGLACCAAGVSAWRRRRA